MLAVKDSVSWHDAIPKKVTLLGKHSPARCVMVMCYGCYANGFWFDCHVAEFRFFFLCFSSGSTKVLRSGVSVVRLGLAYN